MKDKVSAAGNPFYALGNPNYRIYWSCMCLSSFAIWIQNAAQPWLAYSMTDSPMLLGVVSALQFTPMFLFSAFAGVLIDRFSKRTLMLVTQVGFLLTSLLMAVLVFSNHVNFAFVVLVAVLTGLINVINLPLRQAWISSLVPKDMLMNAVALYSTAFNLARIVGPAVAGFVMYAAGLGYCYALNALLFSGVLLGLAFVRGSELPTKGFASLGAIWTDLKAGLRYVGQRKNILFTLLALAVTGIFSINYSVLLPVLSVEILHSGEMGFGLLMSVVGIGSFLGAFTVAAHSKRGPQKKFLELSPLLLAVVWLVVAVCDGPAVYLALAASGFFYVSYSATANVALQMWCEPEYVGRVISFYTLVMAGTSPLGNLYSGTLSDRFGVRFGALACGVAALVCFLAVKALERMAASAPPKDS